MIAIMVFVIVSALFFSFGFNYVYGQYGKDQTVTNSEQNNEEEVLLKKPQEVYYEIYRVAREKAKHMKQAALEAYLDARNIKTKYMLDEINNSEDELSNFSEIEG